MSDWERWSAQLLETPLALPGQLLNLDQLLAQRVHLTARISLELDDLRMHHAHRVLGLKPQAVNRGRDGALDCPTPPSEPDWRISRIRLSR